MYQTLNKHFELQALNCFLQFVPRHVNYAVFLLAGVVQIKQRREQFCSPSM